MSHHPSLRHRARAKLKEEQWSAKTHAQRVPPSVTTCCTHADKKPSIDIGHHNRNDSVFCLSHVLLPLSFAKIVGIQLTKFSVLTWKLLRESHSWQKCVLRERGHAVKKSLRHCISPFPLLATSQGVLTSSHDPVDTRPSHGKNHTSSKFQKTVHAILLIAT